MMAAAHMLHYGVGIPVRRVPAVLRALTGVELSPERDHPGRFETREGSGGRRIPRLRGSVRESAVVHTDDTGFNKLLGRILDEFGLIVCGWSAGWDGGLLREAMELRESYHRGEVVDYAGETRLRRELSHHLRDRPLSDQLEVAERAIGRYVERPAMKLNDLSIIGMVVVMLS